MRFTQKLTKTQGDSQMRKRFEQQIEIGQLLIQDTQICLDLKYGYRLYIQIYLIFKYRFGCFIIAA